jgi:hypothetical protein
MQCGARQMAARTSPESVPLASAETCIDLSRQSPDVAASPVFLSADGEYKGWARDAPRPGITTGPRIGLLTRSTPRGWPSTLKPELSNACQSAEVEDGVGYAAL